MELGTTLLRDDISRYTFGKFLHARRFDSSRDRFAYYRPAFLLPFLLEFSGLGPSSILLPPALELSRADASDLLR